VPYRRKKLTFAISSPDESLSTVNKARGVLSNFNTRRILNVTRQGAARDAANLHLRSSIKRTDVLYSLNRLQRTYPNNRPPQQRPQPTLSASARVPVVRISALLPLENNTCQSVQTEISRHAVRRRNAQSNCRVYQRWRRKHLCFSIYLFTYLLTGLYSY